MMTKGFSPRCVMTLNPCLTVSQPETRQTETMFEAPIIEAACKIGTPRNGPWGRAVGEWEAEWEGVQKRPS